MYIMYSLWWWGVLNDGGVCCSCAIIILSVCLWCLVVYGVLLSMVSCCLWCLVALCLSQYNLLMLHCCGDVIKLN